MKTIKPNKGCKTLLGIGSPLKITQNDEHDIVKQAMECLNNFNRKSAGYQLGLIEGYAKALDDVTKINIPLWRINEIFSEEGYDMEKDNDKILSIIVGFALAETELK